MSVSETVGFAEGPAASTTHRLDYAVSTAHHRLDYLDTIRGLAALSVVTAHYMMAYGLPRVFWRVNNTPLHIWYDGNAAVSLFFVLSGLVLSLRHFRTTKEPDLRQFSLAGYVAARIGRIWIPYAAVVLVSAALVRWVGLTADANPRPSAWLVDLWASRVTLRDVFRELRFGHHMDLEMVPQAWTLYIELILSLLVPVAVYIAGRSVWWLLGTVVVLHWVLNVWPYTLHFALGVVIAKYYVEMGAWLAPRRFLRLGLLCVAILLYTVRFTVGPRLHWDLNRDLIWYITAVGSAMILVVASSGTLKKILSWAALRYVGKTSYSIYLIHLAILIALTPRFMTLVSKYSGNATWILGFVFTVGMTLVLSGITYRFIEVPSIAIGRKTSLWVGAWSGRLQARFQSPAEA